MLTTDQPTPKPNISNLTDVCIDENSTEGSSSYSSNHRNAEIINVTLSTISVT